MIRSFLGLRFAGAAAALLCLGAALTTNPVEVEAAAKPVKLKFFAHIWQGMDQGEWFVWVATAGTKAAAQAYPLTRFHTQRYHPRSAANLTGSGKIKKNKSHIELRNAGGKPAGSVDSQFKRDKVTTTYDITVDPAGVLTREGVLLVPSKDFMKFLVGVYQTQTFGGAGITQRLSLLKAGKFALEVRLDGRTVYSATGYWQAMGAENSTGNNIQFLTTKETWTGNPIELGSSIFIPPPNSPSNVGLLYPLPEPKEVRFYVSWMSGNAAYAVLRRVD